MTAPGTASVFAGFWFPREVISVAVRWYLRYGLSYRGVEELLAERGITVDHTQMPDRCACQPALTGTKRWPAVA